MDKQMKRERGITLIALVVTIVVLLILAAVSISMLTGENGIITQAQKSDDETEQAKCEELVTLAINGLITENAGDKSKIMPQDIADEVNRMENRTDVISEGNTFPTNILFPEEDREVGVNIELGVTDPIKQEIYNEPGLEEEAEKNIDLFLYEPIEGTGEMGAIDWDSLPTKEARITGMNPKYCNSGGYSSDIGEYYENTNYEIILDDGTKLTDTLVVPYQVEIDGELYKITEADISAKGGVGYSLPNVKTIIYPNTIRKISSKRGRNSDLDNRGNTIENIILSRNLKEIGNTTFYQCSKLKNIIIPSSVTSIGGSAFKSCTSLTNITIPDSVTSIGEVAFCGCTSLTSITIPDSVTSIGDSTFKSCTSLTSITIPDSVTSIGGGAFKSCTSLTNITIPDSVTSMGNWVFEDCTSLISITIPESVTSIGGSAFESCTSLTSITIPDSVTSIGTYAFRGCTSLTSVTISEGVTSIGVSTFMSCTSLTSITIPENVTSIEWNAFSDCTSLTTVNYTGTEEEWNKILIDSRNANLTNAQINFNYKSE